jgi:hypothetical protein
MAPSPKPMYQEVVSAPISIPSLPAHGDAHVSDSITTGLKHSRNA